MPPALLNISTKDYAEYSFLGSSWAHEGNDEKEKLVWGLIFLLSREVSRFFSVVTDVMTLCNLHRVLNCWKSKDDGVLSYF